MSEKSIALPNKNEIKRNYEDYVPILVAILGNIESFLKENIHLTSNPSYKTRIKEFSSYYKKILRKKEKVQEAIENTGLVVLTDLIGVRVICPFVEDLAVVEEQVMNCFDVREIERKGAEQSFKEFGYESVHILVAIPKECLPENCALLLPSDLVCEIQIRTILQDAWAEVEHELIYKSEFNPFDKPLRRKLASINASLTLADIIFQEIRDYQKRFQAELGTRRDTFYGKADEYSESTLSSTQEQLPDTTPLSFENPYQKGSIDDLVLKALHEHNLGNFDNAVSIYTKIISFKPRLPDSVLSVIFKHRGMAYFAQSHYDKALGDFKMSVKCDPKCALSIYYTGIVYSMQGKEKDAVENFSRALEIDSFQSHVYYRRAIALYNLGEYAMAMRDLDSAASLGLDDKDTRLLRGKLMKKFDMKT